MMHEITLESYDFKTAFSGHESVRSQFLMNFIRSEDFKVVSIEVDEGNPYIKAGQSPTGLRDLDYSKKVKVVHLETGTEQILNQDEEVLDRFHLK